MKAVPFHSVYLRPTGCVCFALLFSGAKPPDQAERCARIGVSMDVGQPLNRSSKPWV